MSMFFVVYRLANGKPECLHFLTIEDFFAWLQQYHKDWDRLPDGLKIYRAECLFDGS